MITVHTPCGIKRTYENQNVAELIYHFMPNKKGGLSVCIHSSPNIDMFSILTDFLNKFKAMV